MIQRETGTIARVLMVLREVAQSPVEPTMKQLADRVNLPLSTMHRLLELLHDEGMVERDEITRAFRPGAEFFRMAALVVHRLPIRAMAKPFLEAAVKDVDESAYLCILDARAGRMSFAANVECSHMLDYRVPMNTPFSIAVGASGLSILAFLGEEQRDGILRAEARRNGADFDEVAAAKLQRTLKTIRAQGYAQTFGQRIKGAVGIFAPVFDGSGAVCASLGFTVPEVRYREGARDRLVASAVGRAHELSQALGHREAPAAPQAGGGRKGVK